MSDYYAFNRHGIMHSFPDGFPLPDGARLATEKEIADWKKEDAAIAAKNKAAAEEAALAAAQLVVLPSDETTIKKGKG